MSHYNESDYSKLLGFFNLHKDYSIEHWCGQKFKNPINEKSWRMVEEFLIIMDQVVEEIYES